MVNMFGECVFEAIVDNGARGTNCASPVDTRTINWEENGGRVIDLSPEDSAAYLEAVNLAGFEAAEARKFFGEPTLPAFEFEQLERLIRPWPTREAYDRFVAAVEDLAENVN